MVFLDIKFSHYRWLAELSGLCHLSCPGLGHTISNGRTYQTPHRHTTSTSWVGTCQYPHANSSTSGSIDQLDSGLGGKKKAAATRKKKRWHLSHSNWELLEQLCVVLKVRTRQLWVKMLSLRLMPVGLLADRTYTTQHLTSQFQVFRPSPNHYRSTSSLNNDSKKQSAR